MKQKQEKKANLTDKDAGTSSTKRKGIAFDAEAAFRHLVTAAVIPNIIK